MSVLNKILEKEWCISHRRETSTPPQVEVDQSRDDLQEGEGEDAADDGDDVAGFNGAVRCFWRLLDVRWHYINHM